MREWGRRALLILAVLVVGSLATSCVPPAPTDLKDGYKASVGNYAVREDTYEWNDAARLRSIPVRVYRPDTDAGPYPVIIFSPGLGSSNEHYTYLGRHWASHGYVTVSLTHPGSDTVAIFENGQLLQTLEDFAEDPDRWRARPEDVSFVLDHLAEDETLRPLLDLDRVGVAGHSFGSYTALATIGMRIYAPGQPAEQFTDPRVKAVVAISPLGPGRLGLSEDSWDLLATPCLSIYGTRDIDPSTLDPRQRRSAYEAAPGPDQYLLTILHASHIGFDDQAFMLTDQLAYAYSHVYVEMASIAFFDAYLGGDADAQAWLLSDALAELSDGYCELEHKHVNVLSAP